MASEATTETTVHTETGVPGGEAHGGGGNFPPFDSSTFPSQLLWLAIMFGLFYYLMSKVALPRIAGILEDREDRIAGDLAEADRLKRETDEAIAAYEQALAEARNKAHSIARTNREKLEAEVEAKRTAAEDKLNQKLAEADARISEIKEAALKEVDGIAAETAEEIVASLIGAKVSKAELDKAVAAGMAR
ncbi:F-type H+-transporting ATPase subunit b [Rhodobium orientis]|uniref:ATP synthase subunit b n=1 Tax=Rhodobium orientis TaxID=34017 RepID=A0A327JFA5_9HYPH|nr:F0F1 ATP synthase subunit B [Rhodobium orientis]MBB4305639.1 F-type H+-transporting ATPase subunit b [Rhodobium orientis]MBK5949153.1 ATP F0F1 synthase subunit B' [Rhodobium orientis]RAI24785.1 ATP F0F1 synthase subunit B' [Rhodobium orientis]